MSLSSRSNLYKSFIVFVLSTDLEVIMFLSSWDNLSLDHKVLENCRGLSNHSVNSPLCIIMESINSVTAIVHDVLTIEVTVNNCLVTDIRCIIYTDQ